MMELVHITATYSNAVLVAMLPHFSDFTRKLELPLPVPITTNHVRRCNVMPYKGRIEGSIILTNGYWFTFRYRGYVESFRAPNNWFFGGEYALAHLGEYLGETHMTTNEIVTFARDTLHKLGYPPELTGANATPKLEGPWNLTQGGHVPQCRVTWESGSDEENSDHTKVKVEINTQEKTLVGLNLYFAQTNNVGVPLKVDVEPELESEFKKRTKLNMFVRSNAPPQINSAPPIPQ